MDLRKKKEYDTQLERDLYQITYQKTGIEFHHSPWVREIAQQALDTIEDYRQQIEICRKVVTR